jgi:hypothetical protein
MLKQYWLLLKQKLSNSFVEDELPNIVAREAAAPAGVCHADDQITQSIDDLPIEKRERQEKEVDQLRASGLLDSEWYLKRNADIREAGDDPCYHFCHFGWNEGRSPNAYFDVAYYRSQLPQAERDSINPVLHYLREGERRGLKPILYFDPVWYRAKYGLPETESPLRHYLQHATSGKWSPIAEFDVDFYLDTYPDIRKACVDPFQHYLNNGFREGRNPSRDFHTRYYVHRYLKVSTENPLLHYLAHKGDPGIQTGASSDEAIWSREIRRFTSPGPDFEEFYPLAKGRARLAKVLAFYLPQYYSFPENDKWWGKGFTEWTNVARGAPRFKNHYQPRIPRDLGFYDLLSSETICRQVEMARGAGLFGFVFYFYWFNGLRLLEKPLDKFLSDPILDFPFCLMWANENWTRRWDGFDDHVLMKQNYDPNHEVALIKTFINYFRDTRYIRIERRPLLMIYRPGLFPDAAETFRRWRRLFSEIANENPLIIMAQGFGDLDPRSYGLDGAIEHPPHKVMDGMSNINDDVVVLDPDFSGHVYSYQGVVERSVTEPAPPFPLIKTAFPGWDNDARSQGTGMIVHGSGPNAFEHWLSELIRYVGHHPFMGEKFVCVNAWNEWAEGAYLEPDLHFGAAYLNAAARAITAAESTSAAGRIVLVGHDAALRCSQLLLNIAKVCGRRFGMNVEVVLLAESPLMKSHREVGLTTVCNEPDRLEAIFGELYRRGFRYAVLNSVASLPAARPARRAAFVTTALMHQGEENASQPIIMEALDHVDRFVFPAEPVRDQFLSLFPSTLKRTEILSSHVDIFMEQTAESNQIGLADYVATVLDGTIDGYVKVSVVVLNDNDARYLEGRLASIFSQTYPVFEIIVLDNGSSDASLAQLERIRAAVDRDLVVLQNETRAESTFKQWQKAAEIARGDFIWIAQAVDEAEPRFLERLAHRIVDHPDVQLAYTDSRVVDHNGQELLPSYKSYCDENAPGAFEEDRVVEDREFLRHYLSERNLILNVSSAVLRRTTLLSAIERVGSDLFSFEQAGDWRLYVEMLAAGGSVAYVAEPLNVHRRRPSKATPLDADRYVEEIRRVQQTVQQIIGANEELVSRQSRYRSAVAPQLGAGLPVELERTEAWLDRAYSLVQGYALSCADGKHAAEFDEICAAVNGHIGAADVRQGMSDVSKSTASAK